MISLKEKLDDFLFYFYALFVLTISFSIAVGQITLGLSILFFIITILVKKINPFDKELYPFYILIGLYVGWVIFTSLLSPTPMRSLKYIRGEWLMAAIPIGVYLIKKSEYRQKLINIFLITILIVSIYTIIQHFTGIYWFKSSPPQQAYDYGYRVKAFFANRLTFGNYIATASGFVGGYLIYKWNELNNLRKTTYLTAFILSFISTFLTYSYGPSIAILLGLLLILFLINWKYFVIAILLIVISIGSFYTLVPEASERFSFRIKKEVENITGRSRLYIWKHSLNIIADNPLIGAGEGNFIKEFEKHVPPGKEFFVTSHAHNDPLNIAANSGIPGMIIYLLIWWYLFKHFIIGLKRKSAQRPLFAAALIGSIVFFIASMTEAAFADEEIRQMLMFVWAVGLGAKVIDDNSGTNQSFESKTS